MCWAWVEEMKLVRRTGWLAVSERKAHVADGRWRFVGSEGRCEWPAAAVLVVVVQAVPTCGIACRSGDSDKGGYDEHMRRLPGPIGRQPWQPPDPSPVAGPNPDPAPTPTDPR